jgi:ubiquinone/menaquinone biosynthesis C-methylase UbiE
LVESSIECLPYPDQSFDAATCVGLLMHLDADMRVRALRELARVSRGPLVVQYGCVDLFQRVSERLTGVPPGQVRCPVSEKEMRADLARGGLRVLSQSWVMRGLSSSVIVVLAKTES